MLAPLLGSAGSGWLLLEFAVSLLEKMQAQEILRSLRLPEFDDLSQFFRNLPATALVGIGAFAAVVAYWFASRPRAVKPPCDLRMQSEEVEGLAGARRSVIGDSPQLLTHYYDDARTMYEVFRRGFSISENGPCLGFRKPKQPYQWLSYKEVAERAEALGSGLLQQGCKPSTKQFIGVFAQNRPEWIISELACYTYSMVVVPLYDTLGPGAIRYIVNTADISTVICDKPEKARILLDHVERRETPGLSSIILMDPFEKELTERGRRCGVRIQTMQEVEDCGRESRHVPVPPRPEDLSIVCFTSGTTGNPKGAMLTHGNVVADFSGFLKVTEKVIFPRQDDVLISFLPLAHMFERVIQVRNLPELTRPRGAPCVFFQSQWSPTCEDVHISYLPLAHMFERMVQSVVYCHGGRIGFFQGDIRLLSDDMKALRPTIFPVVPRLLNRMYDKIFSQADTSLKRWILEFAAKRKKAEVRNGIIRNDSLWDKLFFNKIQASLGGCVRMIVTGAAPASPTVLGFLRAALGCQVYEGYGQTECTAGCTFTTPGDWTSGHVGAPLPCNLIRLKDVEELNYFASKGEGEICVKGPNVFKGYLKDEEKTTEALDQEGWLHTGDIGKWLPNGTLKIIDRKKHIFKLAQGEYIAPEKIENIYIRSDPVAQIYVHGDSLQAFLVGIVVPDSEVMPGWAKKRGFDGTYAELCKNKELQQAIMEDMVRLGKESGLHSFEQVKAIYIHSDMFSVQNGLLTPTLKAKRPELRDYFKKQIEELYSSISI
ncbi:long-chain-fatty-acid--CoA ligase 6 isoform X1 [Falco rusticolus]|uniref:long-chain-fatty-acid--CoA ligase 6 isoform X1 n=1 Tax=Falco rusticolus TaxID=120794 RepID=UPI00188663D7|nr:long-chain-fatty-acid--CoA ligase 6 isoform X1 [Falco rusticolus]XP_055668093.1 long-chain-fatty-acid--CoA ligase 6 isoform X1 [Falco peregrinus]